MSHAGIGSDVVLSASYVADEVVVGGDGDGGYGDMSDTPASSAAPWENVRASRCSRRTGPRTIFDVGARDEKEKERGSDGKDSDSDGSCPGVEKKSSEEEGREAKSYAKPRWRPWQRGI